MKYYRNISTPLFISIIVFLLSTQSSFSLEIADIKIAEKVESDNSQLVLNGVGIRTKFFFNIYIGSLYLHKKESDSSKILKDKQAKRISLHFLYKEIPREKLITGWISAFKNNNSDSTFKLIKDRIDQFNSYIDTTHKGDVLQLDFLSNNNTKITINNKTKGEIKGNDFQVALLKVWLGDDPADYSLKDALLGESED